MVLFSSDKLFRKERSLLQLSTNPYTSPTYNTTSFRFQPKHQYIIFQKQSSSTQTMQSLTGPGLFLTFYSIPSSSPLTPSTLSSWLTSDYIPTAQAVGAISSATLYRAANPSYPKQNLVVYRIPDLKAIAEGKMASIPRLSREGAWQGDLYEGGNVEWESRIFRVTQVFDAGKGVGSDGEFLFRLLVLFNDVYCGLDMVTIADPSQKKLFQQLC